MRKKTSILIVLLVGLTSSLLSQTDEAVCARLGKLASENNAKSEQVYIKVNKQDSIGKIHVFLVNESKENVVLHGFNRTIEFALEAKNSNGDWAKIDDKEQYCGTGFDDFILPSGTYTWQSFNTTELNDGNYQTEIRFVYHAKDTILRSAPLPARLDIHRFLPVQLRMIKALDEYLVNNKLIPEKEKELLYIKAYWLYHFEQFKEALAFCRSLIEKRPDLYELQYITGLVLMANTTRTKDLSDAEKFGILSKAITEWSKIPPENKKYNDAQEAISVYKKYLPTKEEWEKVNHLECEIINGKYYCYIGQYLNEQVEIIFKAP